MKNIKKVICFLTILFGTGEVFAAAVYPLYCRGGSSVDIARVEIEISTARNYGGHIKFSFSPSRRGVLTNQTHSLSRSECAWPDRGFRDGEPASIYVRLPKPSGSSVTYSLQTVGLRYGINIGSSVGGPGGFYTDRKNAEKLFKFATRPEVFTACVTRGAVKSIYEGVQYHCPQ